MRSRWSAARAFAAVLGASRLRTGAFGRTRTEVVATDVFGVGATTGPLARGVDAACGVSLTVTVAFISSTTSRPWARSGTWATSGFETPSETGLGASLPGGTRSAPCAGPTTAWLTAGDSFGLSGNTQAPARVTPTVAATHRSAADAASAPRVRLDATGDASDAGSCAQASDSLIVSPDRDATSRRRPDELAAQESGGPAGSEPQRPRQKAPRAGRSCRRVGG